jgi:hypothetical protein
MFEISKTPWTSRHSMLGAVQMDTFDSAIVKDADGEIIADAGLGGDREIVVANARLMAAAPELLEACVAAEEFLKKLEDSSHPIDPLSDIRGRIHRRLHAKLRPAIEKAIGGLCPKCNHTPYTPGACDCGCHPSNSPTRQGA